MAKKYAIEAEMRVGTGKGVARTLRRENKVPAVIYGDKKEPINITLPAKETNLEYNKGHMFNTLCDVKVGNDTHVVLARDVQLHPVKDFVEHVDFLRVTSKTKIVVAVPVHFINEEECEGLKEGGILNTVRHEVELACSATNIPDHVEIDLTSFVMGDAVKLSDAKLPAGATSAVDRDVTIATIAAPRAVVEEVDEDAEGEEGAEGEAAEGEEGETAEGEEKAEGDAE